MTTPRRGPLKMRKVGSEYSIEDIRRALGATMVDMARILGVSRQAIYCWKKGAGMTMENVAKLRELSSAAYLFDQLRVRPNSYMLNRPILNGKSFVQLSAGCACAEAMAKRLAAIILLEDEQRAKMARRLAHRPCSDFSDVGVANFPEDAQ
jgi:DNA-binding XRE family transcriptional regulator